MIRLNKKGDTIVEVLIAIAVASSVLAVTYATMNRNLNTTRASQERTEASKLAQGQIEALKARSDAGRLPSSDNFCIKSQTDPDGTVNLTEIALPTTTPNNNLDTDNFAAYETAGCTQSGIYNYAVKEMGAGTNVYRVYVRWERVGGGSREQVIMAYKL